MNMHGILDFIKHMFVVYISVPFRLKKIISIGQ